MHILHLGGGVEIPESGCGGAEAMLSARPSLHSGVRMSDYVNIQWIALYLVVRSGAKTRRMLIFAILVQYHSLSV